MRGRRQDDTRALQPANGARRTDHVRPLMHLVGGERPRRPGGEERRRRQAGASTPSASATRSARSGSASSATSPFRSRKPRPSMSSGLTWWTRNGRRRRGPITGQDSCPHVSATQWTTPDMRSATTPAASTTIGSHQARPTAGPSRTISSVERNGRRDEAGELDRLGRARAGREGGRSGGAGRLRVGDEDGPKLHGSLGARRPPISRPAGRGPSRRRDGRRTAGRPAPWDPRSSRCVRRASSPEGSSSGSPRQRYRHLRSAR